MSINQIYISEWLLEAFADNIFKFTTLMKYHNPEIPSFFYGLGTINDVNKLKNHKNMAVIIWTGTDCSPYSSAHASRLNEIKKMPNVYHIAISTFIRNSLESFGVKYTLKSFYACDFSLYRPCKKGSSIYLYYGNCSPNYDIPTLKLIQNRFPNITFICGTNKSAYNTIVSQYPEVKYYTQEQLCEVYSRCFLSIRLTKHDGLSATVQDLGCMGIKTIWNGGTPSALSYTCLEDIYAHINNEIKTIGDIDHDIAEKTKEFLQISDEFYMIKSYIL